MSLRPTQPPIQWVPEALFFTFKPMSQLFILFCFSVYITFTKHTRQINCIKAYNGIRHLFNQVRAHFAKQAFQTNHIRIYIGI